jgi:hypothetical protein
MKIACAGGSSNVFRNALNAADDNMWTSSMIKTLYLPCCGGMRVCSTSERMCSTELLDAASSSKILNDALSLNDLQDWQTLHAS